MLRFSLILLHLVIGISAIAAGQALALKPSGEALGFEAEWLEGSPFSDYRIPGVFLAAVLGSTNLLSALLQWRRAPFAPSFSLATGLLLLGWLSIQAVIVGYRHPSQLIWPAVFGLTTILSAWQTVQGRAGRRSKQGARAALTHAG